MSAVRRDTVLHLALIATVAIGYILVRIVIAPTAGLLRGYATDLLAGVALPSLLALVLPCATDLGRWARTLAGTLALTGAAAFVWEVVMPALDPRSTADPLDVLAYLAGATMQHGLVHVFRPGEGRAA